MSSLSNALEALIGNRSHNEVAKLSGISRASISKIIAGDSVKLSTLRVLAESLHVSEEDWLELVVAWIRGEITAQDAQKLIIQPTDPKSRIREEEADQIALAMMKYRALPADQRQELLLAMDRPAVMACLPAINRAWASIDESNKAVARTQDAQPRIPASTAQAPDPRVKPAKSTLREQLEAAADLAQGTKDPMWPMPKKKLAPK
jgi:transcriptional regulator with XRE-family HTH domain